MKDIGSITTRDLGCRYLKLRKDGDMRVLELVFFAEPSLHGAIFVNDTLSIHCGSKEVLIYQTTTTSIFLNRSELAEMKENN